MPRHDAFFKTLFESFLEDLLILVAPEISETLDFAQVEVVRDEFFTDLPHGRRRQADLVAKIGRRARDRGDPLIAHIEVEARWRRATAERIGRYALHITLRYGHAPLSVLVNLEGGKPGVHEATHRQVEEGFRLLTVRYRELNLGPSPAREYLARPQPLAWALAALMRPGGWSRARLKVECLRCIATAELDEARRFLLIDCVETYLELVGSDEKEYRSMLAEKSNHDVAEIEMTWGDRLRAEGREAGWEEGRQEGQQEGWQQGRQQGRQEGLTEGMHRLLLRQLARRFGPPGEVVTRRVKAISSGDELERLADRVVTAESVDEILGGTSPEPE